MNLKIVFLGTSNAIPTAQRNHPAIWIESDKERILVDCGEGTQRQFRLAKLNPCQITQIWLTHLHGDHVLGLPGLLETLEMSEYSKTLEIYGPKGTIRHIDSLEKIYGKFEIKYKVHELPAIQKRKGWRMETAQMDHGAICHAYAFVVEDKLRINKKKIAKYHLPNSPLIGDLQKGKDIEFNGKKIRYKEVTYTQPGKKIAIIMDTKINDNAFKIAQKSDVLICESTYAKEEEKFAQEHKHLTAEQAARIAKKAKAKQLILTHISQRYEHEMKKIESEARKIFKNTKAVKDLEIIELKD